MSERCLCTIVFLAITTTAKNQFTGTDCNIAADIIIRLQSYLHSVNNFQLKANQKNKQQMLTKLCILICLWVGHLETQQSFEFRSD